MVRSTGGIMPYHLDFSAMTLADLKLKLERADLIPSQLPLLDGIDKKLAALKKAGVQNLEDLSHDLRGSKGPSSLAARSGISEDYLVLLRRTIEGFRPKPLSLREYPGIDEAAVRALAESGIADSKSLYEAVLGKKARTALAKSTGIAAKTVDELAHLSDLSRIQWVGSTFARVLYEAGYRGPTQIAAADPEVVYEAVLRANESNKLYRGKIGLRDIKRLVKLASELDEDMES
jgi:predicted flap endonuclease-1-like 5' DNA nuclease